MPLDMLNEKHRNLLGNAITSRSLELTILPTEKCNFRCTYCYEDFEHGRMADHVLEGIENLIERRGPGLEKLSLSWFGGEPLLAKSVVLRISKYALEASRRHGFFFQGGLTTNAYTLDRKLARQLLDLNQEFFQITLDGWGEVHDRTRRLANGGGTFSTIWENIWALREQPHVFDCLLRIHLTPENIESTEYLCQQIGVMAGNDQRFRLDIQNVRNMGGELGSLVESISDDELDARRVRLLQVFAESTGRVFRDPNAAGGLPRGESASSQRATSDSDDSGEVAPYICYAAKPNSLLIRSTGRIGKCTVAFKDERNDLGHLNPDGTIKIDEEKLRFWSRGIGSLDLEELSCPLHELNFEEPESAVDVAKQIPVAVLT